MDRVGVSGEGEASALLPINRAAEEDPLPKKRLQPVPPSGLPNSLALPSVEVTRVRLPPTSETGELSGRVESSNPSVRIGPPINWANSVFPFKLDILTLLWVSSQNVTLEIIKI